MNKSILIFILFSFYAAPLKAQKDFHKLYDYLPRVGFGDDGGYGIVENNKDYIAFGLLGAGGMRFLKVNSIGNPIFDKAFDYNQDILFGGGKWNSGYYGFGEHYDSIENARDVHLMFLDNSGDSLRYVNIDFEFNDRCVDALKTANNEFVMVGQYTDTNFIDTKPYIARVDSLGTILWQESHDDSTLAQFVTNVAATQDGGYIIGGEEYETSQGWLDLFLIKVDNVGKLQWKKTYGWKKLSQYEGHVSAHPDGGFVVVGGEADNKTSPSGQRWIFKTDSAGNILWEKKFGTSQYNELFQVARILSNGDFICTGSSFHTFNNKDISDINITRLDSAGNLIWSKDYTYYGQHSHDYVKDLQITSDSGFVMTGFIINNLLPARNDLFILKVNDQGIITSVNSSFKEVPTAWKIYPNPTQGLINIPESKDLESIQVYNLSGQKVQETRPNQVGETQIQLEGPKGIYLIQLQKADGSIESAKVVKK